MPCEPMAMPYATASLPGCGGRLKARPEDFRVEELPAYEPCGSGEHLYLWVEKRGLSTQALLEELTAAAGLPRESAGHAGLKDAQAVTAQWISLHTPLEPALETLHNERWRVLKVARHTNKLRPGHLRGNRFEVSLREVRDLSAVDEILRRIEARGFPNYFGEQRFGQSGDNAARGREILLAQGRVRVPPHRRKLLVHAYQSALFNRLLATRLRHDPDPATVLAGDWAVLHRNGASFPVEAAGVASARSRADAGELSASAPLFGGKAPLATGQPGEWERAVLEEEGLSPETFQDSRLRNMPRGERRPVRTLPGDLDWEPGTDGALTALRLRFTLPPGVYATSLLREVMKNDAPPID